MNKRIGIQIDAIARFQNIVQLARTLRRLKENALGASESVMTLQQRLEILRTVSEAFQHLNIAGAESIYVGRKMAGGFLGLARSVLSAYGELERYQITLQTVEKSSTKAAKTLAWAKKFASTTPFELRDVIGATVVFRNMGLSAQRWLRVAGDMAAAMGVNIQDATYAIARAAASGPEGMMALTRTFGITTDMLKKFGWTGKGSIEQFRRALEALLKTRFEGGMARFMNTMGGVLSNIRDIFWNFRAEIGKPIDAFLTQVLKRLLNALNRLKETGKLTEWAKAISEGFLSVLAPAVRLAEALGKLFSPLWNLLMTHPMALKFAIAIGILSSAFMMLGGTLLFFGGMAGQAILGLRMLGLMLGDFTMRGLLLRGTLMGLKAVLSTLFWPVLAPLRLAKTLFIALSGAITSISWPLLLVAGLLAVLATAWLKNWGNIREKTLGVLRKIWDGIKTGVFFTIGLFKVLAPAVGNVARNVAQVWLKVAKTLFEALQTAVRWIAKAFSWLWRSVIKPVLEKITGALAKVLEWASKVPGLKWAKPLAETVRNFQKVLQGAGVGEPGWLKTFRNLVEQGRTALAGAQLGKTAKSIFQAPQAIVEKTKETLGAVAGPPPALPQPQPILAGAAPTITNNYYTIHYERDSIQVRILSPNPEDLREKIRRIFEEEVLRR